MSARRVVAMAAIIAAPTRDSPGLYGPLVVDALVRAASLGGVHLSAADRLTAAPLWTAVGEPLSADTENLATRQQGKRRATNEGMDSRASRGPGAGSRGEDVARVAVAGDEN